ncbi:hypothetical protein [Lentzea sp.]|uniref:hypothetical protein n=1 Tax=Lentzea sp. TaxID=56099 RepID=UPI002C51D54C|nr:hypothetical protein [Lentzea sp.]HUQ59334.1 hypothetical protein [Lentzea sp.]
MSACVVMPREHLDDPAGLEACTAPARRARQGHPVTPWSGTAPTPITDAVRQLRRD